ncbi:MAG: chorismate mutase [Clostridia bacterium]|jgi:chorismate mutase|nr:chorismate mutase [Clostridia bacterium]
MNTKVRGIRGAISVEENTKEAIWKATRQLLLAMVQANQVSTDDIASIFFAITKDLNQAFPARAARQLGWHHVPLLDVQEAAAPDLPRIIRVMMHVNTSKSQDEIVHVYLGEAIKLRPDLAESKQ